MGERRKMEKLGEVAELRKRRFESMEETEHGVDTQQPQRSHELVAVPRITNDAVRLAGCICLARGEHAAKDACGMNVRRSVWRQWKQQQKQLHERQMLMARLPCTAPRVRR